MLDVNTASTQGGISGEGSGGWSRRTGESARERRAAGSSGSERTVLRIGMPAASVLPSGRS